MICYSGSIYIPGGSSIGFFNSYLCLTLWLRQSLPLVCVALPWTMVGFWANTDVQNCRWQFLKRVTSTRFMRWASGRFTGILRQTFQDLGHWPLILHSVGGSCKSPILKSATTDWAGGRIYNMNFVHHWWLLISDDDGDGDDVGDPNNPGILLTIWWLHG